MWIIFRFDNHTGVIAQQLEYNDDCRCPDIRHQIRSLRLQSQIGAAVWATCIGRDRRIDRDVAIVLPETLIRDRAISGDPNTSVEKIMKITAKADNDRFQSGAKQYANYLETPEGRLRSDLTFANLQDFLPSQFKPSLRALDLGCGTGATAICLARLGIHVTLLDSSSEMLDIAKRAAQEAGITDQVIVQYGDATQLADMLPTRSFDVILCHNILEYCDDPGAVLRGAACALRDSSAILSVLVRNQAGEVLKAAIQAGDLAAAENSLTAEWGKESLYKGSVRLFTPDSLRAILTKALLATIAERGVRAIADYLPPQISRSADYERIFALERKLGNRPEYAAIARYAHYLARCPSLVAEDGG
jgi:S-adenosylmethionine-dependent methyltransferase